MKEEGNFNELKGKVLKEIKGLSEGSDRVEFITECGLTFIMYHSQGCCESVQINDIEGNIQDLIGGEILQADEETNSEDTFGKIEYPDSFTWTFYKLATIKGYVTIRWLGESNGYYSESVTFYKI